MLIPRIPILLVANLPPEWNTRRNSQSFETTHSPPELRPPTPSGSRCWDSSQTCHLRLSRKMDIIRDSTGRIHMTYSTDSTILARIYGWGRGKAFTPKDFLDLASHETVRKILSRAAEAGTIRRILRGVYDYPAFSSLLNAPASPDPHAMACAIARAHGWTILPAGDTALNLLGLSTQVPAQWQYFSDGPTKRYAWQGGTLALKHRTNKETTSLSPKTALVVQALKTLGKDRVDSRVLEALRSRLDRRERERAVREARYVTSWVYEIIKQLAAEGDSADA